MALMKLLYGFPTCLLSFPHRTGLTVCFPFQHYNRYPGWDEWIVNNPRNSRRKFKKRSAPTSYSLDWPRSPWNQSIGRRKRKENHVHGYVTLCFWRECICVWWGMREISMHGRGSYAVGQKARPTSVLMIKIRRKFSTKKPTLYLHWRLANSSP